MTDVKNAFCPNIDCEYYGLQNRGNIAIRGKYGKNKVKGWQFKIINSYFLKGRADIIDIAIVGESFFCVTYHLFGAVYQGGCALPVGL